MIAERRPGPPELLLLGVVRGFVGDIAPMVAELERFRPGRLAVGIGAEEMASYTEQFVGGESDPYAPLLPTETAEVLALARYGEVAVPHAPFLAALRWAHARSVPTVAADPDEASYADLFTEHIGYWELVRRTVRERSLARDPPKARGADEFALRWAGRVGKGRASRRFDRARSELTWDAVRPLRASGVRVALLADRERVPLLLSLDGAASSGPRAA